MMVVGITNGTKYALFEQINIIDSKVHETSVDNCRVIRMSEALNA